MNDLTLFLMLAAVGLAEFAIGYITGRGHDAIELRNCRAEVKKWMRTAETECRLRCEGIDTLRLAANSAAQLRQRQNQLLLERQELLVRCGEIEE